MRTALLRSSLLAESFYHKERSFRIWYKKGNSPCTDADIAVNDLLQEDLSLLLPEAGWLSEESARTEDSQGLSRVWIVDPIDGTRDFIKHSPEFSISAGLIQEGLPISGGIALPASREIILGENRGGIQYWEYSFPEDFPLLKKNMSQNVSKEEFTEKILPKCSWQKKPLGTSLCKKMKEAKVLVSRAEWSKGKLEDLQKEFKCIPESSIARKLARLAVGEADMVISIFPKHEWDIAAGAALISSRENYTMIELENLEEHLFNRANTLSCGLAAGPSHLIEQFCAYWETKHKKKRFTPKPKNDA